MSKIKLVGWEEADINTELQVFGARGKALSVHASSIVSTASGTPTHARFIIKEFNGGSEFRVVLYGNTAEDLVAYSDWLEHANIAINTVVEVPVIAVKDVAEGDSYNAGVETLDGAASGNVIAIPAANDTPGRLRASHDDGGAYVLDLASPPDPRPSAAYDGGHGEPIIAFYEDSGATARISFTDGDPDTRLRDRDGLLITAADVPIRVSTQRDPRGAPALTGAPVTMSITDGAATLDLSAADPMPTTGDAIYVEVFDQKATPEDDISRRYVLRMQDGATAGE